MSALDWKPTPRRRDRSDETAEAGGHVYRIRPARNSARFRKFDLYVDGERRIGQDTAEEAKAFAEDFAVVAAFEDAEATLCALLISLGYQDVVNAYALVEKPQS